MLVRVGLSGAQIRYYAESALNGFRDLSGEDAVANAKADLESILRYLDMADEAVAVLRVRRVKARVGDEVGGRGADHRKASDFVVVG